MSYEYITIDGLLDDLISNRVSVSSLSNTLIEELLYHIVEVISDKNVDCDSDTEKFANVLENLSRTMEFRIINDTADDFTGDILNRVAHGSFQPIENNFTLH